MQPAFEQMGLALSEVSFVVVDLETTGGAPGAHAITEIGAVRVRAGQVLSEMGTLVNPGAVIPPQITLLTGITNAMVAGAPMVAQALERFLGWAGLDEPGTVLVAHNARFDVGHLRAAARELGLRWPEPVVVDTLALARRAWSRAEVPNHRLATLSSFVGSPTRPTHRALDDARATVDVLHAALEELATLGVTHVEDLATASDPVPAARRAKSRLADGLPSTPGVYEFVSSTGEVLYVGSAVDLRRRVRSYFTAAERRTRVAQMLDTTVDVRVIPTPTEVEARVRELRLIDELDPVVNRHSRHPRRRPWLRLAGGAQPRLVSTTLLGTEEVSCAVGPFASRSALRDAQRAAESVLRLRSWDGHGAAGLAPQQEPAQQAELARRALSGECDVVAAPLLERVAALAAAERFEEAGLWTARLRSFLEASRRAEAVRPLLACPHLVAARRREGGGWELVAVRWGRLAGSAVTPPGADPRPAVTALRSTAQAVQRPERVGQATSVEETLLLAEWVLEDGARLVEVGAEDPAAEAVGAQMDVCAALTWPVGAAARHQRVLRAEG
ncbi:DEDD exonuclease domain-containing protein [Actinomyces sp. W5033]|uniref:DEDD exonuclease domain-containing protein n=1 Tax=Actinomyces sp. W5033 TaxID=3446479 RepID=UPI003EE3D3FB